MSNVILCNLSDAHDIVKEERVYWINDILDLLRVPEEAYDVNSIDEYRDNMDQLGIEVDLFTNGDVNVYKKEWFDNGNESGWLPCKKEHLVAQWKQPTRIKKIDDKGVYYELHLNNWSVFGGRKK